MKQSKKKIKQIQRALKKSKAKALKKAKSAYEKLRVQLKKEASIDQLASYQPNPLLKLQNTMNFIRGEKNLNRDDQLGKWTSQVMHALMRDDNLIFNPGDVTPYYKIDEDWDENDASLISKVTFFNINDDPEVLSRIDDITSSKWGSKELHEQYLEDARHQGYKKHTENLMLDISKKDVEQLENLMNSSTVWHFVADSYGLGTKAYDSDQADEDWQLLFSYLSDFSKNKNVTQSDLDTLITMMNNQSDEDLNSVVRWMDEKLESYRN